MERERGEEAISLIGKAGLLGSQRGSEVLQLCVLLAFWCSCMCSPSAGKQRFLTDSAGDLGSSLATWSLRF